MVDPGLSIIALLLGSTPFCCAQTTVLPKGSFHTRAAFDKYWSYNYPWGNTHNGAARMDPSQCFISSGHLMGKATYKPNEPDLDSGLAINYLSCTVFAQQTFTVEDGGGYDITADFIAPTVQGAWPALWLTAVQGWPPEIDIAEWKGDGKISFNSFNTSSDVTTADIDYPDEGKWHTVLAEIRDEQNGSGDVSVSFYLDGSLQSTQYANAYIGKALYMIIDLQMEGSSGSPGPMGDTIFAIKKLGSC